MTNYICIILEKAKQGFIINSGGIILDKYKHFISLGFFCSVALELERIGLRDCASPFDWCISEWGGVERAIDTHFKDFLEYENMYQNRKKRKNYMDMEYGIAFFHDFNNYQPLKKQIKKVRQKYNRRIERFYMNIQEPTLFIRYISSENGIEEIAYLEEHYEEIVGKLRKYNKNNDIIFVANNEVMSKKIELYRVVRDENDTVARLFLDKNKALCDLLNGYEYSLRDANYNKYLVKQKKKENFLQNKLNALCRRMYGEYIHDKVYSEEECL